MSDLPPLGVLIDPSVMVKQPFLVVGKRECSSDDPHKTMIWLCNLATNWFLTQPKVCRWRARPEISVQADFETKKVWAKYHARGFFDVDVPATQGGIYKEL